MNTEEMKRALEAAYLAGFGATGEGYNAEYPFEGKDPEQDDNWLADRDEYVRQALANEALDKMAENAREMGLSYEQPAVKTYCGGKPNYCIPEQPAPAQEPVAWVRWEMGSDGKLKQIDLPVDLPLATTPPASKQGPVSALTNLRVPIERINEIQGQLMAYYSSGAQAPKDLLFAASDCIGALAFDLIDAKRAAQPTDLNLNCKSVQARLATQWGYVKAEAAPKQCWKCGDMDAQFQAKCTVPYCAMKELP